MFTMNGSESFWRCSFWQAGCSRTKWTKVGAPLRNGAWDLPRRNARIPDSQPHFIIPMPPFPPIARAPLLPRWLGTLLWLLLASGGAPLFAQPNTVVVPSMVATQNLATGSGTLRNPNFRIQQVYGSQNFPTQGMIITELRFQPDSFYGRAFTTTVAGIQFNLSTARVNPDGLSPAYASNVGLDDTVVFPRPLNISAQFLGAEG